MRTTITAALGGYYDVLVNIQVLENNVLYIFISLFYSLFNVQL